MIGVREMKFVVEERVERVKRSADEVEGERTMFAVVETSSGLVVRFLSYRGDADVERDRFEREGY